MENFEERDELYQEIMESNLIPSLKKQIKMIIQDKLISKKIVQKKLNKTENSELIDNIILEFLLYCGFHNTASIFFTESSMHQLPRSELTKKLNISNEPIPIFNLLLKNSNKSSISTQTDIDNLERKLEAIDSEIRQKKILERTLSAEEQLIRGIEEIDYEFELKFNSELQKRLEIWRSNELSDFISEFNNKSDNQLNLMRKELEYELKEKINELKLNFLKSGEHLRSKQREMEIEIGKWAEHNINNISKIQFSHENQEILKKTDEKLKKIEAKSLILNKKYEEDLQKLEDKKLEHKKVKRRIETLKLSISIFKKNNNLD